MVVLKASREKLPTFLARAKRRDIEAAIYIEDMFQTGHDAANRETVTQYATAGLPLVGIAVRADWARFLRGQTARVDFLSRYSQLLICISPITKL